MKKEQGRMKSENNNKRETNHRQSSWLAKLVQLQ